MAKPPAQVRRWAPAAPVSGSSATLLNAFSSSDHPRRVAPLCLCGCVTACVFTRLSSDLSIHRPRNTPAPPQPSNCPASLWGSLWLLCVCHHLLQAHPQPRVWPYRHSRGPRRAGAPTGECGLSLGHRDTAVSSFLRGSKLHTRHSQSPPGSFETFYLRHLIPCSQRGRQGAFPFHRQTKWKAGEERCLSS